MMFSWLLKRGCCRPQQSKKYYAVVFFASLTRLPVIKPFTISSVGIITNRHATFTSSSSSVSTNNSWLETKTYSHFPIVTSARSRRYSATTDTDTNTDEKKEEKEIENRKNTITIISRDVENNNFLVALKPPSVFCHPSEIYTGKQNKEKFQQVEIPMLQRVCDFHSNYLRSSSPEGEEGDSTTCSKDFCCSLELMHSLDRGASGALLFTYKNNSNNENNINKSELITKTYVALVRGEGINKGENYLEKGWFDISRQIKQNGISYDTTTSIKFIASTTDDDDSDVEREETTEEIPSKEPSTSPPRLSLVLVKTKGEERLHQIRRVLRQISHPIIGDSKHGDSKTNREWKEKRNLSSERLCLHLSKIEFPSFSSGEGEGEDSYHTVSCSCSLYKDLVELLKVNAPNVWKKALTVLQQEEEMQEGVVLLDENDENNKYEIGEYNDISTPPPSSSISTSSDDGVDKMEQPIEILQQGKHYVVANKPSGVVVHNSSFNSDSTTDTTTTSLFSTPMLQRIRNQTNRRVNLIHRLDRGTSGCLLFSFASNTKSKEEGEGEKGGGNKNKSCKITKRLNESMQDKTKAIKTYIAFCDGDGAEYLTRGWFTHDQPVKNEWGKLIEGCTTDFRFIKSITLSPLPSPPPSSNIVDDDHDNNSDKDNIHNSNRLMEGRQISIVLARPKTGRWHQIRQHLRQLNYHTILNDSSHGKSRTNRNFREYSNVNRLCLHLARIQIPFNDNDDDDVKEGEGGGMIDVTSPIPTDMLQLFEGEFGENNSNSNNYDDDRMRLKEFWEEVKPILVSEGVSVR